MASNVRWPGLITNADPHDLPPGGAVIQENLQSLAPGKLTVRKGFQHAGSTGGSVQTILFRYHSAAGDQIVVEDANGSVYIYANGMSTSQPEDVNATGRSCFAQTRAGKIVRVHGNGRGSIKDGSRWWKLGITGPTRAPTVQTTASGGAYRDATYCFGIRFDDAAGAPSNLSPLAEVTTPADQDVGFFWTNIETSNETDIAGQYARVVKMELYRSTADQREILYLVGSLNAFGGYLNLSEGYSDEELLSRPSLPVNYDDGSLCARRYGVPPTNVKVVCPFQDRMFYAVQKTEELAARNTLYYSERDDGATVSPAEAVPTEQNAVIVADDQEDSDDLTGLFVHGSSLYIGKQRHLYRLNYSIDPRLDGAIRLVASRGLLHQRAVAYYRDTAYMLDQMGPWRMGPEGEEDFDQSVHDYWSDGRIDYTKAEAFFVAVEPNEAVVRYFIILKGESLGWGDHYPMRALCYCVTTDAWWMERYQIPYGSASRYSYQGRTRTVVGSTGRFLFMSEGCADLEGVGWQAVAIPYTYRSGILDLPAAQARGPRIPDRRLVLTYQPTDWDEGQEIEQVKLRYYYDHDVAAAPQYGSDTDGLVATTDKSGDVVIDLRRERPPYTQSVGRAHLTVPGRTDAEGITHQFVSLELTGQQRLQRHVFYGLDLEGD